MLQSFFNGASTDLLSATQMFSAVVPSVVLDGATPLMIARVQSPEWESLRMPGVLEGIDVEEPAITATESPETP